MKEEKNKRKIYLIEITKIIALLVIGILGSMYLLKQLNVGKNEGILQWNTAKLINATYINSPVNSISKTDRSYNKYYVEFKDDKKYYAEIILGDGELSQETTYSVQNSKSEYIKIKKLELSKEESEIWKKHFEIWEE